MAHRNEDGPTPNKRLNTEFKDAQLVRMFCQDLRPVHMLEDNGFQEFIKNISDYTLPSTTKFSEMLNEEYNTAKSKLMKTLESVSHAAISVETWRWRQDHRKIGYYMISVTIHFVHEDKLVSRNLFTIDGTRRKNKTNVNMIKDGLKEWRVFRKVVCYVGDNETILEEICANSDQSYIICVAARINSVIQGALNDDLQFVVMKEEDQKRNAHRESTTMTHESFSWYNDYISYKEICKNDTCDNATKIKKLHECVQILKRFDDFYTTLCSVPFLNLSLVIPLLTHLKARISECSPSTEQAIKLKNNIEYAMKDVLNADYKNKTVAAMATFMDPRFKSEALVEPERAKALLQYVKENLEKHEDYPTQQNPAPCTSENRGVGSDGIRAETSVAHYVQLLNAEPHRNPYACWKSYYEWSKYSEFYLMSQKYLCIPATIIPIHTISNESAWDKIVMKIINLNARRNHLEYESINNILFLHSYYSDNAMISD